MEKFMILAGGFLIGLVCGLLPLVLGFLTSRTFLGLVGAICCAIGGALYVNIGKSPLTSLAIAALFILFIVLNARKKPSSTTRTNADTVKNTGSSDTPSVQSDESDSLDDESDDDNSDEN